MRPGPVARATAGGLARKRVQTIVIGLVLLVSTGACVLALALVADSSTPFDHAFAAQRGAHAIVVVSPRARAADRPMPVPPLVMTATLPGIARKVALADATAPRWGCQWQAG